MTPSSILKGTAVLLFLQGVSTVALNLCGIKFPPALLAMILLLVLLLSGVIRIRTIEDVCNIFNRKNGHALFTRRRKHFAVSGCYPCRKHRHCGYRYYKQFYDTDCNGCVFKLYAEK